MLCPVDRRASEGSYLGQSPDSAREKSIQKIQDALKNVPEPYREAIESVLLIMRQVGKNRNDILESQRLIFLIFRNLNRDIADIHDTLRGLGKHR